MCNHSKTLIMNSDVAPCGWVTENYKSYWSGLTEIKIFS